MEQVMKRIPAILLAGIITVIVAFAIGAFTAQEAHATLNGEGTKQKPYEISDYDGLKEFASIVNGTHPRVSQNRAACGKLMNDIDCSGYQDWVPIGNHKTINDDYNYTGHFDGDHKVIHDLCNEAAGASSGYQGLFGYIKNAEVKDVGIVGGKITGTNYVGSMAGFTSGETIITNCYNTGMVSGTGNNIGGLVGRNYGTITNCYNTGVVSGTEDYVGGVAGYNDVGTITNCYNAGAVSGTEDYVGGVAGYNGGPITNCYNTGVVSGTEDNVGGVVGKNNGTITNCYFDNTFSVVTQTVGSGAAGTNVKSFATDHMIGTTALDNDNMVFSYNSQSENPWCTKANGKDAESGVYYSYYPHLKGFAYDSTKSAADWPGKLTTSVDWRDVEASYPYNGSPQGPTVTKVTMSQKPVKVPSGMTGEWRSKTVDESSGDPMWSNPPAYDERNTSGAYWLKIKDGDKVIEEMVYIILRKEAYGKSNDYTVRYQVQEKTAGGGTEWSDFGSSKPVDGGKYKVVVTLAGGTVLGEKEFRIVRPLTITAPAASTITYGQTLNDSKLTGGACKDGDAEVPGTFTWDEPDTAPAVSGSNHTEYGVTFTPSDTVIYDPQAMKVTVTVNKAPATVTAAAQTINEGESIASGASRATLTGALSGHRLSAVTLAVKSGKIVPSAAVIKDAAGQDVTSNYDITYKAGALKVIPREKLKDAESEILNMKKDKDPTGAKFAPLKLRSTKQTKTSVTLKWNKPKDAVKYVVYGSKCGKKNKPKKFITTKKTTLTVKKLAGKKIKKGTYYKFIVVAVDKKNKVVSKSKLTHVATKGGKVGNVTKLTIKAPKKAKKTLKVGKTVTIKVKQTKPKKLSVKVHMGLRFESSNKKIATVTKKGVVKAVKKGTCYIYAYTQNGKYKSVKITVK